MPFVKRLTKFGNSIGLVLDRPFLKQLDLEPDAEVELTVESNAIVIRPHRYATDVEADKAGLRAFKKHRKALEGLSKR